MSIKSLKYQSQFRIKPQNLRPKSRGPGWHWNIVGQRDQGHSYPRQDSLIQIVIIMLMPKILVETCQFPNWLQVYEVHTISSMLVLALTWVEELAMSVWHKHFWLWQEPKEWRSLYVCVCDIMLCSAFTCLPNG